MKPFKIRASQVGKIMTQPKLKKDKEEGNLSATAKSYLEEWFIEQMFNRRKEMDSKFTVKGTVVEDDSIALYCEVMGINKVEKNENQLENDYLTGEPDIFVVDRVVDIKSSWGVHTFPFLETSIPTKSYWWQLQAYMILTGMRKAELAYCLVDTPEDLIHKELHKAKWAAEKILTPEEESLLEEKIRRECTFGDIPKALKVKTFEVQYDPNAQPEILGKVMKCREYLKELESKFNIL